MVYSGSLFHELRSLTKYAALLCSKRKLWWLNLKLYPRKGRSRMLQFEAIVEFVVAQDDPGVFVDSTIKPSLQCKEANACTVFPFKPTSEGVVAATNAFLK